MRVQHAEEVPKATRLKSQVWNIETIIFTHRQAERHMIMNTFETARSFYGRTLGFLFLNLRT